MEKRLHLWRLYDIFAYCIIDYFACVLLSRISGKLGIPILLSFIVLGMLLVQMAYSRYILTIILLLRIYVL